MRWSGLLSRPIDILRGGALALKVTPTNEQAPHPQPGVQGIRGHGSDQWLQWNPGDRSRSRHPPQPGEPVEAPASQRRKRADHPRHKSKDSNYQIRPNHVCCRNSFALTVCACFMLSAYGIPPRHMPGDCSSEKQREPAGIPGN